MLTVYVRGGTVVTRVVRMEVNSVCDKSAASATVHRHLLPLHQPVTRLTAIVVFLLSTALLIVSLKYSPNDSLPDAATTVASFIPVRHAGEETYVRAERQTLVRYQSANLMTEPPSCLCRQYSVSKFHNRKAESTQKTSAEDCRALFLAVWRNRSSK